MQNWNLEKILHELGEEVNITSKDKKKKTKKSGKQKSENKKKDEIVAISNSEVKPLDKNYIEGAGEVTSTQNDISNEIKTVPILAESTQEKSKLIGIPSYISPTLCPS